MKPHLVRWNEQYGKKGLQIFDIDDGSIDKDIDDIKASVKKSGVSFPVLWDEGGKLCDKYGATEEGYPRGILIGVDGERKWEGFPLPKVEEIESLIEAELAKVQ